MKVALFGGSGRTGRLTAQLALEAGHGISILARDPASVGLANPQLRIVTGDARDVAAVRSTLRGTDAAIVAIGTPLRSPGTTMSEGTATIIGAAQAEGVGRLIVVSADGAGHSRQAIPFPYRIGYFFVGRYMAEKERQEAATRGSGLAWTIVRPAALTDGPATGQAVTSRVSGARNEVSRADLAGFLVDQLESTEFVGKTAGLFGSKRT